MHLKVPYTRGDIIQRLYSLCLVVSETHTADGTEIVVDIPEASTEDYVQFAT